MNIENFKLIVNNLKPDNIYLNSLDCALSFMPNFVDELDIITAKTIIQKGIVAHYFGVRIWVTFYTCDVERNFIKISKGDQDKFDDLEWSLPICLDWHINDIEKMWKLKAFW